MAANAANVDNPKIKSALDTMTHDQVPAHFDTEHAESYSSYMTVAMEGVDLVMDSVFRNVADHRGTGDDVQTRRRVWADANYRDGDVDGEDGLGNFDYTLTNLVIGGDMVSLGAGELGGFIGYGRNEMDEHDLINQDFTSDVFYLGLYLNSEDVGGWDIRSTLGYAYGNTESERDVNFGPYYTRAKGDFNSNSFFGGVRGSTPWYSTETVTLSPELGLLYAHYKQDSFKESGDPDLALALDSATAQSLVTSVGLKADFANLSDTHSVKPTIFVRYEYDWLANDGDEHEVDAGLVAHSEFKLPFVGQNRGPHALVTGVGLSSDPGSDLQVKGGLLYSYASYGSEWGAALNLQYAF